jgi:hypothetical protein
MKKITMDNTRVSISLSLTDLDIILKALDSADFYPYSAEEEFFEHLGKFKIRLQNRYDSSKKKFQEKRDMIEEFIVGLFREPYSKGSEEK